ncbi:MAG: hypothetical protein ABMA64_07795 [Myxococcota bacterium]
MKWMVMGMGVLVGCGGSKICGACDDAEGLVFCTDCPTTETCIASIEDEATGEVVYECESAPGESCITDQLVATCPDV